MEGGEEGGFWEFLTVSVVECSSARLDAVLHYSHQRTSSLQFMENVSMNKHCSDVSLERLKVYFSHKNIVINFGDIKDLLS